MFSLPGVNATNATAYPKTTTTTCTMMRPACYAGNETVRHNAHAVVWRLW